jgi:carboxyl-terminal processing protease
MSNTTRLLIAVAIIVVVVLSFGAGYFVRAQVPIQYPAGLDKIAEVWDHITKEYVDPSAINTDNMSASAIEGIMKALDDPYSVYLDKHGYDMFTTSLQGDYEGIGAYVSMEGDNITISSLIPGSPAEGAGLLPGDVITAVDGQSVTGMALVEAIAMIRGPEGTTVSVTVIHQGQTEPVTVSIVRAKLNVPSVLMVWQGDIADIVITQFTENTAQELTPFVQQINDNPNAKGIVLDLRNNPGGLLDIVVEVASHFITDGLIVEVQSNIGTIAQYKAVTVDATTNLPMIVLVNEASASGAEVLSGALQDHGRATIAGTTTFGKGSVDNLYRLKDGTGLYLTIMRWLTPNGRLIEGHGIDPDVPLTLTGQAELDWAVQQLDSGNP